MKKLIILLSGVFVALGLSFSATAAETKTERKLQSAEEIEALMEHLGLFDEELAIADEMEYEAQGRRWKRRPPYRRRPPVHRRPPYRRPPIRRAPPRHYVTVCYAENYRGHRFSSTGYSAYVAQQRAMDQCYRYSRRCFQRGCYTY